MGWGWGSLSSSAQRPCLALCLQNSAWAKSWDVLGWSLGSHFLQEAFRVPSHSCPSAVPFGATCWNKMPSQPWGLVWRW